MAGSWNGAGRLQPDDLTAAHFGRGVTESGANFMWTDDEGLRGEEGWHDFNSVAQFFYYRASIYVWLFQSWSSPISILSSYFLSINKKEVN